MVDTPANDTPYRLLNDVQFGEGVVVYPFTNLYGCTIGDLTQIGPYVEIQRGAEIGACCKIQSHTFVCEGVRIEDGVFIGHGVMFVNDKFPRSTTEQARRELSGPDDWTLLETVVEEGASIGSGVIVLGGITIGKRALVGAGAVVTRNVGRDEIVAGVPARVLRIRDER